MKTLVVAAGIVASLAFGASAMAQTKQTVAVIVKDTTSPYWQAVLAGARQAGRDFGVSVAELGAQSESDTNGQIEMLEKAVASNPAAIVLAPAQAAALGRPIDEAAKKVKIIGIGSAADTKAMTSLLATDNVNAGRIAAEALAAAITKTYGDTEGNIVIITSMPGVAALDQRAKGFKEVMAAKYRALDIVADKIADGKPATVINIVKEPHRQHGGSAWRVRVGPDHDAGRSPGRGGEQIGRQDQRRRGWRGRNARQAPAG